MINVSNRNIQALLIAFSLSIYIAGIGSSSILTQGDESDYIRSSQEMFSSGDLLTPTFRGKPRFTKPPLLYWMLVSSYEIFGVNFFASRLPMVICGVLVVIFVYRMGLVLFDRNAAIIAALLTATSFGMVKFSKIALMESPLVLTMLLTFYYFARFHKENDNRLLIVSFVFLGLSSLLKSPIYSVLAAGIIALFLATEGAVRKLYSKEFASAIIVALLVSMPWYLAMVVIHGPLFFDFYVNEHVNKFTAVPHHILRVWAGLLLYLLPWTFYFIYSVITIADSNAGQQW